MVSLKNFKNKIVPNKFCRLISELSHGFVHPEKRTLNYGWLPPEIYFCQGRHVQAALGLLLTHACLNSSDRTLQLCLDSKAPEFSRHSMLLNSKFRKNEMAREGENKSAAIRLAHIAESVSKLFDLGDLFDFVVFLYFLGS